MQADSIEWQSAASLFSRFSFSFSLHPKFKRKSKIIYQIMRPRKPSDDTTWQGFFADGKIFSIFKFLYFYVDLHFLFCSLARSGDCLFLCFFRFCFFGRHQEAKTKKHPSKRSCSKCRPLSLFVESRRAMEEKQKEEERRKEGNKRFTLNWLSFKCLWFVFFINFAVAFHPLFDRFSLEKKPKLDDDDTRGKRDTCESKIFLFVILCVCLIVFALA